MKIKKNPVKHPLYRIAGKLRGLKFSRCQCKRGVFNLSEHQISQYHVPGKNKIIVSMLCK